MPFTRLVVLAAHLAQAALRGLHHRLALAIQVGLAGLEEPVVPALATVQAPVMVQV
jgi:hypothetical protein